MKIASITCQPPHRWAPRRNRYAAGQCCVLRIKEFATLEIAPSKKSSQFTWLFENSVLGQVERMRLNPNRRLTNRSRGEHLSGKGGASTDFADYRDYVPGDDMRYVDWNIFARLNRPYIKQFQHEEEMHVVLLVDASTSMKFDNKFERARQIAGALGVMGLMNVERVSAYSFNHASGKPLFMPPKSGRQSMRALLSFLEGLEAGGDYPVESAIESMLRLHRGRGVAIVISDFLTFGEVSRAFNMLFSAGLEIFAAQVLAPSEIEPDTTGDIRFVDSETGHTLDITSAGDLMGIYREHRLALEDQLARFCRQRSGRFVSVNSGDPIEHILFDLLTRQGWVNR